MDGLIAMTTCWKAPLYRVEGNIYGLPNAPFLWTSHAIKILVNNLGYVRRSWDVQLFLKYNDQGSIVSMIMVYVDELIGCFCEDYNVEEVRNSFKWGDLGFFALDEPRTFKGKELTFTRNKAGRVILRVTMSKFL